MVEEQKLHVKTVVNKLQKLIINISEKNNCKENNYFRKNYNCWKKEHHWPSRSYGKTKYSVLFCSGVIAIVFTLTSMVWICARISVITQEYFPYCWPELIQCHVLFWRYEGIPMQLGMLICTDPRHLLSELFRYLRSYTSSNLWNFGKIHDNIFVSSIPNNSELSGTEFKYVQYQEDV